MTGLIHTDLHVHLYGCLRPVDVWELGRDSWKNRVERLDAYAGRLELCAGTRPPWPDYWRTSTGIETLAENYLCTRAMRFEEFEARFALAIALFPVSHERDDLRVLRRVMETHRAEGRRHVEYRYVYPPRTPLTTNYTIKEHLDGVCEIMRLFAAESSGTFEPRLAMSLSRNPVEALTQYANLKAWQAATPEDTRKYLTAIDFSGYEETTDVMTLEPVCRQIHADNASHPRHALALLIHAGETMEKGSVEQAVARVMGAVNLGAHRVGHAVALGFSPEARRHVATRSACVIESCITSNLIVAGVPDATSHPVREFVAEGLSICLATDDPGIFATDARKEYQVAETILGRDTCARVNARSPDFRSEVLSGRLRAM